MPYMNARRHFCQYKLRSSDKLKQNIYHGYSDKAVEQKNCVSRQTGLKM